MLITDNILYIFKEDGKPTKLVDGVYFAKKNNSILKSTTGKFYVTRYDESTKDTIIIGEILDTIEERYTSEDGETIIKITDTATTDGVVTSVIKEEVRP